MAADLTRAAAQSRLDMLFAGHIAVAAMAGPLAILLPRAYLWFLHEENPINDAGLEVSDIVIRLYGSLICGQGILVHAARKSTDANTRRSFVQAYTVVFALTTASLLWAQFTGHFSSLNWLNILMFGSLLVGYGYFGVFERISTFQPSKLGV